MVKFREVVSLELKALVRSRTLALLTVASVLWVTLFPLAARSDGTADGARELVVRYSLAGVFALLVVSLLASATGSLARERAARRLQLTLVRPIRPSVLVLGKLAAHVAVGALVLAVSCGVLAAGQDLGRRCHHVLSPVLPSPAQEAREQYARYLADPQTPKEVRETKREIVLRLLERKAFDRYESIATNATATWTFEGLEGAETPAVRFRFTNQYGMRQDLVGDFALGDWRASVSNITQAILTIPLRGGGGAVSPGSRTLTFRNRGAASVMLRPRQDVHLLAPADTFGWNLVRAYVALVALVALVVGFGLFLSAGLGRPVAIFVAFVALIVSELSPSVIAQYPDGLETDFIDRVGLAITRAAVRVTEPLSAAAPFEALANDECVEPSALLRLVLSDLLALPVVLSLVAALILPRKQEDD